MRSVEDVRECGESRVLPRTARSFAVAKSDGVPGRPTEVAMIGCPVGAPEHVGGDVPLGEVSDGVTPGLVQQHDVITLRDPGLGEPDPHPPPERFRVEESRGEWVGDEKPSDRPRR